MPQIGVFILSLLTNARRKNQKINVSINFQEKKNILGRVN